MVTDAAKKRPSINTGGTPQDTVKKVASSTPQHLTLHYGLTPPEIGISPSNMYPMCNR